MFVDSKEVQRIKDKYPVGTRIVVDYMDDPRPIAPGTKGTVRVSWGIYVGKQCHGSQNRKCFWNQQKHRT